MFKKYCFISLRRIPQSPASFYDFLISYNFLIIFHDFCQVLSNILACNQKHMANWGSACFLSRAHTESPSDCDPNWDPICYIPPAHENHATISWISKCVYKWFVLTYLFVCPEIWCTYKYVCLSITYFLSSTVQFIDLTHIHIIIANEISFNIHSFSAFASSIYENLFCSVQLFITLLLSNSIMW